jgi:hypothetical protein
MSWIQTEDLKKPNDLLSPYEDWDDVIRSGYLAAPKGQENWQPVYVELTGRIVGSRGSAKRLSDILFPVGGVQVLTISVGDDTLNTLRILIAAVPKQESELKHRARLFVYRPQSFAHFDIDRCYKVLHVGPAVPLAFVAKPRAAPPELDVQRSTLTTTVVTGIIDDAIGVVNERFRHKDGTTRVAFFWKQGVPAVPADQFFPSNAKTTTREFTNLGVTQGVALNGAAIDATFARNAFNERATYREIETKRLPGQTVGTQYLPQIRTTMTQRASHGTFVADLAAGHPKEAAPNDRPIIAVELPALASADTSGARLEIFVLEALLRLIDWADNWPVKTSVGIEYFRVPLVVNLSYGFSAGTKDGSGFLESEIAQHVAARNKDVRTAVVLAAGNDFRQRMRAKMTLEKGETRSVDWRIAPQDRTPSFLEIRFPRTAKPIVTIEVPNDPGGRLDLHFTKGNPGNWDYNGISTPTARVYVQEWNGHKVITLALRPTQNLEEPGNVAPAGKWRVTLRNDKKTPAEVVVEVQRDDAPSGYPQLGRQSYLEDDLYGAPDKDTRTYTDHFPESSVTRLGTLSAMATNATPEIYVVGAAIDVTEPEATRYTSSGPNPARPGPDLAAMAEDGYATPGALAAGTFSGSVVALGGTSAAVPRVTRKVVGWIAQHPGHPDLPRPADLLDGSFTRPDPRIGLGILVAKPETGRIARRYKA